MKVLIAKHGKVISDKKGLFEKLIRKEIKELKKVLKEKKVDWRQKAIDSIFESAINGEVFVEV